MVKLVNFVRLLISLVRLAWRTLCFSWNHGGQLRLLTDELRHVVNDGQLAVHGVTLGTATMTMARANSVEVQRFTDYARVMLETDLVPASLPTLTRAVAAATSEAPRLHALRNELSPLIDTALPGVALDAATTATRTVAANYASITTVLNDAPLIGAALDATMNTLRVAAAQPAAVTSLLAAANHLIVQQPLTSSTLTTTTKALQVASTNMPHLVSLNDAALNLLNTPFAAPALTLTTRAVQIAVNNEPRLRQVVANVLGTLATSPVEETFKLAETGAQVFWKDSKVLWTMLQTSGPVVKAVGDSGVHLSYVMSGAHARPSDVDAAVDYPDISNELTQINVVKALDAYHNLLTTASQGVEAAAGAMRAVSVPTLNLTVASRVSVPKFGGGSVDVPTSWTVNTQDHRPLEAFALTLHDPTPGSTTNTITKRIGIADTHLLTFKGEIKSKSDTLFDNSVRLIALATRLS